MSLRISLCITCKGRLSHLMQTLPENLSENADTEDVEFIVLDYDSPDNLSEWIRTHLEAEIAMGKVVYVRAHPAPFYRSPHAKNLAHAAASGDILVNLDADHFTGRGFAAELRTLFQQDPSILVSYDTGGTLDGIIAVSRQHFLSLRGYDEVLGEGWGYDDTDFRNRAITFGLQSKLIKAPGERAIVHSGEERIRYMSRADLSQVDQLRMNMRLAYGRKSMVNPEGFGRALVYRNFAPQPLSVGYP